MKILREWKILFAAEADDLLDRFLGCCAKENYGWHHPRKESANYTKDHGSPAGYIDLPATDHYPAVHVAIGCQITALTRVERINRDEGFPAAPRHHRRYKVFNIFPSECGIISQEQYNAALVDFDKGARLGLRKSKLRATIKFASDDIGLEGIITSEVCRRQFKCYLQGYPRTFHPSDILQLDRFTGCIFRYNCKLDTTRLAQYLRDDLGWTAAESQAVERRIQTGLDVLRANRGR